eukprot:TRINITY_DN3275_c0_g1_i1.p1 TRINITY_DN3275_c0_g1~~TRINITY_DN3275_c0_g1_i1.p1  ORF type:complete len:432 (+),score=138.54 TRINITY_DN3275_c0_g1_i1:122-1417(+)
MRCWTALLVVAVLCGSCRANDNGLGWRPAMGWSTWCTGGACGQENLDLPEQSLHDVCTEAEIVSVAQAMVDNGMQAVGFTQIVVDDCWAAMTRDADGNLQGDPDRFPNGMASFVATLHAMNFTVGLYTSCGIYTCSSGQRPHQIPGSWGHYEQDAKQFAAWQVDWMKFDWCAWHFNDTVLIPDVQSGQMERALNASGRPIWLNMQCPGYGFLPTEWCATYGNSYRIWTDHHDNWNSTLDIIGHMALRPDYARFPAKSGAWPDPDALMTGGAGCDDATPGKRCPGMTDDEYRTEFSLWAIFGGQMVVATDVRNMSALQKEVLLNTEIIDVFRDPYGETGTRIADDADAKTSVWARHLHNKCAAIVLLNHGDVDAQDVTVRFADVPEMAWRSDSTLVVRDLWAHESLGSAKSSFTAKGLQPHQCSLVTLCPSS